MWVEASTPKFTTVVMIMHSWEECTVSLDHWSFTPMVFLAHGALPLDGTVGPFLSCVVGVPRVCNQLRLSLYGILLNKVVSGVRRFLWQQVLFHGWILQGCFSSRWVRKGDVLHGAVSIGMLAELTLPPHLSSFINCCTVHLRGYPSVTYSIVPTETAVTLKALLARPDRLLASDAVDDLGRCHRCKLNWSMNCNNLMYKRSRSFDRPL